ncbi:MAG: hypothetical protein QOI66_3203 [Myxococcales bacterium]|jgi:hypothetical protein|nr:hypothetical protein [Myxococcales bacterium]HXI54579.1 hypothetical protein [Polyangia bacterium]
MGKAEDKRAAIVAQQAAREAAERAERGLTGTEQPGRKRRTNWAASTSVGRPGRGRPRKPTP